MTTPFERDRLTWTGYTLLAWFAYLQAAPGLVVPRLRAELDLGYAIAGLHVSAFAAGCSVAGLACARVEAALGRRALWWSGVAVLAAGTLGLTTGPSAPATLGAVLVMGLGGGAVLTTVQSALADHHGPSRTVALAEANVAASIGYLLLIGALSLVAMVDAGWRVALLASLVVPALAWTRGRGLPILAPTPAPGASGRLPGAFWVAGAVLVATTGAEWCITAWGASFVGEATDASDDAAVALMAGYFGGFLVGRVLGSALARTHDPARLLALALGAAGAGFAVLWPSSEPAPALLGLVLLGAGIGNLFPMGLSVAVALAPGQIGLASSRAVAMTAGAGLLAPFAVGTLADATSLSTALAIVPVLLGLAAVGLLVVRGRRVGVAVSGRTSR